MRKRHSTLSAKGLNKQYGKRMVVKDVDVFVERGEIVGLLGPNGAGKTTCFHIVTGLIKPNKGKIIIDGLDITDFPIHIRSKLGIGYLPQEQSVFRGLTVEENLMKIKKQA